MSSGVEVVDVGRAVVRGRGLWAAVVFGDLRRVVGPGGERWTAFDVLAFSGLDVRERGKRRSRHRRCGAFVVASRFKWQRGQPRVRRLGGPALP